ncbi:uncharacterized protein [Oscarella lobularis]|uniref:uncharacterized protein isoform X1 n=1 Tax=Oscarella lobularis TaxID=121494 RepID=UPI0033137616
MAEAKAKTPDASKTESPCSSGNFSPILSDQELALLKECRRNSALYRGVPLGTASAVSLYLVTNRVFLEREFRSGLPFLSCRFLFLLSVLDLDLVLTPIAASVSKTSKNWKILFSLRWPKWEKQREALDLFTSQTNSRRLSKRRLWNRKESLSSIHQNEEIFRPWGKESNVEELQNSLRVTHDFALVLKCLSLKRHHHNSTSILTTIWRDFVCAVL